MIKVWRILLIVTLALGLLQGLIGVILLLMGLKPGGGTDPYYYLHYVYGGIVALGIPFVWLSFTSNDKDQRRAVLFYSIAALVMVAAGARALMTGLGMA
jgi:heme A synthase